VKTTDLQPEVEDRGERFQAARRQLSNRAIELKNSLFGGAWCPSPGRHPEDEELGIFKVVSAKDASAERWISLHLRRGRACFLTRRKGRE